MYPPFANPGVVIYPPFAKPGVVMYPPEANPFKSPPCLNALILSRFPFPNFSTALWLIMYSPPCSSAGIPTDDGAFKNPPRTN